MKKLPLVFICENNFYATHSYQLTRQAFDNIYKRSSIYKIPGIRVDGNDVLKVYKTASKSIDDARKGKGPSLIEYRTYRWLEHVGCYYDYELGYRSKEDLDKWMKRCPVKTYEAILLKKKIITQVGIDIIKKDISEEIEEAVAFAKNSPFPVPEEALEDIYR